MSHGACSDGERLPPCGEAQNRGDARSKWKEVSDVSEHSEPTRRAWPTKIPRGVNTGLAGSLAELDGLRELESAGILGRVAPPHPIASQCFIYLDEMFKSHRLHQK